MLLTRVKDYRAQRRGTGSITGIVRCARSMRHARSRVTNSTSHQGRLAEANMMYWRVSGDADFRLSEYAMPTFENSRSTAADDAGLVLAEVLLVLNTS